MKRILWAMVLAIVPVFILWTGYTSIRTHQRNVIGTISNKRITLTAWYEALRLAELWTFLHTPKEQKITTQDIQGLAIDFLVLSQKAEQEKISVSDDEVVTYIKTAIFEGRPFDEESYAAFLRYLSQSYRVNFTSRIFEESIRAILRVEKLIAKNVTVTVSEAEARRLYERDNVKAKIAYLFIPYDKFKVELGISESSLKEFYEKHKDQFRREEKIKLKYTIIPKDKAKLDEITKKLKTTKNISEVCNAFSLPIKETGLIGIKDPIEEIGWQPHINLIAFGLADIAISPPIETEKGFIVMQRIETKPASSPALGEIIEEVKQAFIMEGARRDTEAYSKELLNEIIQSSAHTDLRSFAKKANVEFNETALFGYGDYIEGLGLDEQLSGIVFSLNSGQIYSEPVMLSKGAYIIQLLEKTPVDEDDFATKQDIYMGRLQYEREMQARQKFILNCLNEANVKITSLPQPNQD